MDEDKYFTAWSHLLQYNSLSKGGLGVVASSMGGDALAGHYLFMYFIRLVWVLICLEL